MAKSNTRYICAACGSSYSKWMGQCASCKAWNTLEEKQVDTSAVQRVIGASARASATNSGYAAVKFTDFGTKEEELPRLNSGMGEFDRVCGGGIVPGSVVLLGGDPGVGKSTLLLQVLAALSPTHSTAYISGEESTQQLKRRAQRLKLNTISTKLASATSLTAILQTLVKDPPEVIVIDSIQTMYLEGIESLPGNVTQVRACALEIVNFCKTNNVAAILVGHVTREGQIAGPKVLEHMVDAVIHFEGETSKNFRILRTIKNRFGSSDEIGVFAMLEEGLEPVDNPSALFLSDYKEPVSGSAIFAGLEGSRALLIEIQALVASSSFATPRRSVIGIDLNRLYMLVALLETRYKVPLSYKDIYISVAGGLKVTEPAVDLAVCAALLSAVYDRPLDPNMVFMGEVSLSGQIRTVPNLSKRLNECKRLGFNKIFTSSLNNKIKTNNAPAQVREGLDITEFNNLFKLISKFRR